MKQVFYLLAVCLWSITGTAQTIYHLEIHDNQRKVMANLPVRFIETSTFERLEFKTDANGVLDVTFDHGEEWSGSAGDMTNCLLVKTNGRGRASDKITYDLVKWERENRLLPDRTAIKFKIVPQKFATMQKPDAGFSCVKIVLEDRNQKTQANIPVTITCFARAEQYTCTSNPSGEAIFVLPNNNDYEIDVADINSLNWVDLDDQSSAQTLFILYERKPFTEKQEGKYTVQFLPKDIQPVSGYARVKLRIRKDGSPIANEPVYLKTIKSTIRYKGKTDANGEIVFMLPHKAKYLVNFTFQKDAGVIDLTRVKGLAQQEQTINYIPDPRLENIESFIPRVKDLVEYDVNNFVTAQYPSSEQDVEVFLKWGNKFNASSKEAVLEVGFRVNQKAKKSDIPKNLMFVVDVSGSMSDDDRLELLKNNLIELIRRMKPTDRIGIVAFDNALYNVVPSRSLTNKEAIIEAISALSPKGGTNIGLGLEEGLKQLLASKNPAMVNRCILLTDGYGGDDPIETIEMAKSFVSKGLQISAIGVGPDYNAVLLEQLASIGGGNLQMAGDATQFQSAFIKEMNGFLDPVGKDVTLEVEFNDQIVYRQLIGYSGEKVSAGKVSVSFDQLFPALEKMALVKLDVINPTPEIVNQKVVARLRYTDAVTGKPKVVEKTLSPEWSAATGKLDMTIDMNQKKMLAVAVANQYLKRMAEAFQSGNRDLAKKEAEAGVKKINTLFPDATPSDIQILLKRLDEYIEVFEQLADNN